MMKIDEVVKEVWFISALIICGMLRPVDAATLCNEPAVVSMKNFIDDNITEFKCKVSGGPEDDLTVTTYSCDDVSISQHIRRNEIINLVYMLNDAEIDIEIGRYLFYRIEDTLSEIEIVKAKAAHATRVEDSCKLIDKVLTEKKS